MDGWMYGWTDRWMDGWMDRWVDGWMVGWMDGFHDLFILYQVKLDMGAFGPKKNFCLKVNLKEGMLILTKQGDFTRVTYPHHDG